MGGDGLQLWTSGGLSEVKSIFLMQKMSDSVIMALLRNRERPNIHPSRLCGSQDIINKRSAVST